MQLTLFGTPSRQLDDTPDYECVSRVVRGAWRVVVHTMAIVWPYYGHIWPYYGYKWPYMAITWPYMATYGHLWPYMAIIWPYSGHMWPFMAIDWPYFCETAGGPIFQTDENGNPRTRTAGVDGWWMTS